MNFVCVLLLLFASLCACHNKLVSPTPWNPNPLKAAPCGGGFALTVPQAYWSAGSKVEIQWIVIGDGLGDLTVSLAPAGATDFTQVLLLNVPVLNLGMNVFNLTVPDVTCTGVNKTCTLQVFSTDGWYECTSISIVPPCQNCTPERTPNPSCVNAVGLRYCSHYNNTSILLNAGFSYENLDLMVNKTVVEYSAMPIFVNGTNPNCQSLFKDYLCATTFPTCDGTSQSCRGKCNDFTTTCGIEPSHQALYNCSLLESCPNPSSLYTTITVIVGISIAAVVVTAFILNFIVCRNRTKTGYTTLQ